ncbi:hypothetical protein GF351_05180 [Candidatus Woesearchaeota archaeon]|nr:hypothetical protein [Candidatus Woesearchaeota archaeon]
MSAEDDIQEVVELLKELKDDSTVPKNVKIRIDTTISSLSDSSKPLSIRVNRALHELEEICDDANMQAYTRTQIWNVVSLLEKAA